MQLCLWLGARFGGQLWVSVLTSAWVRVFLLLIKAYKLAGPETSRGYPVSASYRPVESFLRHICVTTHRFMQVLGIGAQVLKPGWQVLREEALPAFQGEAMEMHCSWETANSNFRLPTISTDNYVPFPNSQLMSTPWIYKNPRIFHCPSGKWNNLKTRSIQSLSVFFTLLPHPPSSGPALASCSITFDSCWVINLANPEWSVLGESLTVCSQASFA